MTDLYTLIAAIEEKGDIETVSPVISGTRKPGNRASRRKAEAKQKQRKLRMLETCGYCQPCSGSVGEKLHKLRADDCLSELHSWRTDRCYNHDKIVAINKFLAAKAEDIFDLDQIEAAEKAVAEAKANREKLSKERFSRAEELLGMVSSLLEAEELDAGEELCKIFSLIERVKETLENETIY